MATGFETLPSQFTKFWHPPVDATDRFDPTFLGVPKKAKIIPVYTVQQEEKGKRIRTEMQKHDPTVLLQLPELYQEPAFSSNTESNRFSHGFHRRAEANIQQDRLRVLKDTDESSRKESQAAARRVRGASRNFSQFDTITGQPTFITKHYPNASPQSSTKEELLHRQMKWPEMRSSTVFPQENKTSSSNNSSYNSTPMERSLTNRQRRLMNEGLVSTKREWSVAQQLACNDGYVTPKI